QRAQQERDDRGDEAHAEHEPPVDGGGGVGEGLQQDHRDDIGAEDADRDHPLLDDRERAAALLRRELGDVRGGDRYRYSPRTSRRSGASTQSRRCPALTCGAAVDRSVPVLSGGLLAGRGGGAGLLGGTALRRAAGLLRAVALLRRAGLLRARVLRRAGALLRG